MAIYYISVYYPKTFFFLSNGLSYLIARILSFNSGMRVQLDLEVHHITTQRSSSAFLRQHTKHKKVLLIITCVSSLLLRGRSKQIVGLSCLFLSFFFSSPD